jgi:hypothetical protein
MATGENAMASEKPPQTITMPKLHHKDVTKKLANRRHTFRRSL